MINSNEWKQILRDGVSLSHLMLTISVAEKRLLNKSIDAPINEARMERDTKYRLNKRRKK